MITQTRWHSDFPAMERIAVRERHRSLRRAIYVLALLGILGGAILFGRVLPSSW